MSTWYFYFPIFLVLYLFTKHFLNKIQNLPPSPFPSLPIIGHLHLLKRPIHRALSEISKRHGSILFLKFGSRSVLVISSPSLAEECLTKNDIVFANRPRVAVGKILGYNFTSLAWSPYGDHWRNLRRISSLELLSTHRLQLLSSIRVDEVKILICKLLSSKNQAVEFKTLFFELTLNVMMRMIAGKRYYGENVADVEKAKRFREIHMETFQLSSVTNIGDYLPWMRSRDLERRLIECQKKRDMFMQSLIEEHRKRMGSTEEKKKKKKTMMEVLLSLQETEPEYYKDEIIRSLMLVLLLAGTDTTVNTMEWALSLLLNHPHVLRKAQIEIETNVGHDRLINESDFTQLPYLRSIINETLRMYSPAPLLIPHQSSEECMVGGFRIPRGTALLVNMWAIQNDPKIWVEPEKFRPERFEGLEGARDGYKLMPFGSGRRGCPGEGLGLRMVGLTLGSLIQCFEWERVDEEMVDMREGHGFTLPKAQPLQAKCQPRLSMVNLISQI